MTHLGRVKKLKDFNLSFIREVDSGRGANRKKKEPGVDRELMVMNDDG